MLRNKVYKFNLSQPGQVFLHFGILQTPLIVSAPYKMFVFLITTTTVIGLLVHFFIKKQYGNFKSKMPGPSLFLKLPLVGHGYLLRKHPIEALNDCYKKYGKIFR